MYFVNNIIYIIYQIVQETSQSILEKIPAPIPLEPVIEKYPVKYEESMNTVLIQEVCTVHYTTSQTYNNVKISLL